MAVRGDIVVPARQREVHSLTTSVPFSHQTYKSNQNHIIDTA